MPSVLNSSQTVIFACQITVESSNFQSPLVFFFLKKKTKKKKIKFFFGFFPHGKSGKKYNWAQKKDMNDMYLAFRRIFP